MGWFKKWHRVISMCGSDPCMAVKLGNIYGGRIGMSMSVHQYENTASEKYCSM